MVKIVFFIMENGTAPNKTGHLFSLIPLQLVEKDEAALESRSSPGGARWLPRFVTKKDIISRLKQFGTVTLHQQKAYTIEALKLS
ncbi:hypothetical protein MPH61_20940 [Peribacillus muralis]|uniref:hypothetical protein n=1 Tax=Peribacillus muralis TaxID=264697 RepID=UPI001F4EA537|nr:hypothetical protein [Peribacillus muralis]MCK1995041.1 hypothetical protein [Peribacillus muralis]MCK2015588.1 hypothetical protein [Peribacillus muralis]